MKIILTDFCKISVLFTCLGVFGVASASQAPNPRSGFATTAVQRSDAGENRRGNGAVVIPTVDGDASRVAVRRTGNANVGRNGSVTNVPATVSRNAVNVRKAPVVASVRPSATVARSATNNVVRSATPLGASGARSATSSAGGVSRAGVARATKVFDDVSKLGNGYAACRDAYTTCMDQLCAKANETYRRCFCSARFSGFRDTETALDEAKTLLMQFEDNSLNAVDKTAAEVNAMYSATVGEAAIKKDTSAAQDTLSEISDLLSGRKKATPQNTSASLGILSLDFTADVDDIWSGDGESTFFGSNTVDLSQMEGLELYKQANAQCLKIITDSCASNAVLNMVKSSYSILITQDCNAYEKKINAQREAVKNTVRTAEKYLRDARLEEYRAHNSADVNECIGKVKSAIQMDTACGAGYKKCLDYTGAYVNPTTGEAHYTPRLSQLKDLITLDGKNSDVLSQNDRFNTFLDEKRIFAETALDTCRGIRDVVWTEFKRSALVEIAQAQDALLEKVQLSCVSTMKECYDTQSDELKSFDDTTAKAAGASSAYAARAMCEEKVIACASLYGDTTGCVFDGNGKLTKGNTGNRCGLTELLAFVDAVDTVRVAENCATAINNYVKELCTPTTGDMGFPWNCRTKPMGTLPSATTSSIFFNTTHKTTTGGRVNTSIADNIVNFAVKNCSDPTKKAAGYNDLSDQVKAQVERVVSDIQEQLGYQFMELCELDGGVWMDSGDGSDKLLTKFYSDVYGSMERATNGGTYTSWGRCVENTVKVQCEAFNAPGDETPVAVYDSNRNECTFKDAWYKMQCERLGGYYEDEICLIPSEITMPVGSSLEDVELKNKGEVTSLFDRGSGKPGRPSAATPEPFEDRR